MAFGFPRWTNVEERAPRGPNMAGDEWPAVTLKPADLRRRVGEQSASVNSAGASIRLTVTNVHDERICAASECACARIRALEPEAGRAEGRVVRGWGLGACGPHARPRSHDGYLLPRVRAGGSFFSG